MTTYTERDESDELIISCLRLFTVSLYDLISLVYVEHANGRHKAGSVEENAFRIVQLCKTIQTTSKVSQESNAVLMKHGLITETVKVGEYSSKILI